MNNNTPRIPETPEENKRTFPLGKINFILMAIAAVVIITGFLLMLGAPSGDVFNADIFSVRRTVVGPTIAFLGFIYMGFGIIYKGKK
ncbi:MAG: DUF3098 domain-containing protein [Muribaculaceae bacterium]|nr:DUF3098 domain-containing protein [Muribaculaceae bacterium]